MLLIIAGEIAVIWSAYTQKGNLQVELGKRLNDTLMATVKDEKNGFYKSWDYLQREVNNLQTKYI